MPKPERRVVEVDGVEFVVELERSAGAPSELRACVNGEAARVRVLRAGASARVLVGDRVIALTLPSPRLDGSFVHAGATRKVRVASQSSAAHPRAAASTGALTAPMPGRVVDVRVEVGQEVERGAALVVIEAMKMQNELFASVAGVVKSVHVRAGDAVERGALLIELA